MDCPASSSLLERGPGREGEGKQEGKKEVRKERKEGRRKEREEKV